MYLRLYDISSNDYAMPFLPPLKTLLLDLELSPNLLPHLEKMDGWTVGDAVMYKIDIDA